MGAKEKAKANVNHVIGKAKPNGKAKAKGKANVKGKADGQEQDQAQPQELASSSGVGSSSISGWDCIQPGQPLGKVGSNAARYMLKALVASGPREAHSPHEAL